MKKFFYFFLLWAIINMCSCRILVTAENVKIDTDYMAVNGQGEEFIINAREIE